MDNLVSVLKEDHARVKALFREFEEDGRRREKKELIHKILTELKIHKLHVAQGLLHELKKYRTDGPAMS